MKQRRLIVTRFNARRDNLGDLLIHRCLWKECSKYGQLVAYGASPGFDAYPVVRFRTALMRAFRAKMRGYSVVLLEPPGARLRSHAIHANRRRTMRKALFALVRPRTVRAGISVADGMDLKDMRDHAWVGARDHHSLAIMRAQGVAQARYCPDLAFLLEPVIQQFGPGERALMSFRARIPDDGYSPEYEERMRTVIPALVSDLASHGLMPEFYFQVTEDEAFCREMQAGAGRHGQPTSSPTRPGLDDLAGHFRGAGVVLSNRLHVLLEAAAFGSLPVAVTSAGHRKLRDLFASAGWENLVLDIQDAARCRAQLGDLLAHREAIRAQVHADFKRMGALTRDSLREMLGVKADALDSETERPFPSGSEESYSVAPGRGPDGCVRSACHAQPDAWTIRKRDFMRFPGHLAAVR